MEEGPGVIIKRVGGLNSAVGLVMGLTFHGFPQRAPSGAASAGRQDKQLRSRENRGIPSFPQGPRARNGQIGRAAGGETCNEAAPAPPLPIFAYVWETKELSWPLCVLRKKHNVKTEGHAGTGSAAHSWFCSSALKLNAASDPGRVVSHAST